MSKESELASLRKRELEMENLKVQEDEIDAELALWKDKTNPKSVMELLHKYNDLKDATQILLGAIGNIEGLTVKELHKRFNLPMGE